MKNFAFIVVAALALSGCSIRTAANDEQKKHEFVLDSLSAGKEKIFNQTMKWIAENFRSAKQVIDYQDKQAGTIIAKGAVNVDQITVFFTLIIDIKENKMRLNYKDLEYRLAGELTSLRSAEYHEKSHRVFEETNQALRSYIVKREDF